VILNVSATLWFVPGGHVQIVYTICLASKQAGQSDEIVSGEV
jgi:hypothetical protein